MIKTSNFPSIGNYLPVGLTRTEVGDSLTFFTSADRCYGSDAQTLQQKTQRGGTKLGYSRQSFVIDNNYLVHAVLGYSSVIHHKC